MARTPRNLSLLPTTATPSMAADAKAAEFRSRRPGYSRESRGIWVRDDSLRATGLWYESPKGQAAREFIEYARAVLEGFPGAALTHSSAAAIYGMPGADFRALPLHLWRSRKKSGSRKSSVKIWHADAPSEDIVIDPTTGLCLTSMRLTLLIAARTWTLDSVVAVLDWMIREPREAFENRTDAFDTVQDISAWLSALGPRHGAPRMREALLLARVGSDSPMETLLRLALLRAGLPDPVCNGHFPLNGVGQCGADAEVFAPRMFQPDLAFPEWKVAVEYQGSSHASPSSMRRDMTKKARMEAAGWTVVQIHADHMADDARVAVQMVRAALLKNGWTPSRHVRSSRSTFPSNPAEQTRR